MEERGIKKVNKWELKTLTERRTIEKLWPTVTGIKTAETGINFETTSTHTRQFTVREGAPLAENLQELFAIDHVLLQT